MGCGGNGACTVSSTFIAGGNAPSGCLSCGGAGTSGALAGCACKHKHPSKPDEIQFSGGDGATPPGNRVPANFVTVPPPKKDAKRPNVPFVPGANKADVPSSQNNGGIGRFAPPIPPPAKQSNGKAPIPSRIFDAPADLPISMPPPKESAAPVPFLATTPIIDVSQAPNPFAPYCGKGGELDPVSALCQAGDAIGLSPDCKRELVAFLKSGSSQTLGSWINSRELCREELRRAVGIAEASIVAKTSAGLYDKPGFGNPFGVGGYAWKQDRMFSDSGLGDSPPKAFPSPFAPQDNGATMDWRKPSGGMPNYHRPSGGTPTLAEWTAQGNDPEQWQAAFGGEHTGSNAFTASNIQAFNQSQAGADLYRRELAQAAAASPPSTPPPDYAAIIGSIGTAVGGVFSGINTAVNNAAQNRLRELEIEYANNARGAQLALQRSTMEMQAEIARLSAQSTPAAQAAVTALQQQVADANARLAAAAAANQGMGTGTAVALGVGAVAVIGLGAYVLMGGKRR